MAKSKKAAQTANEEPIESIGQESVESVNLPTSETAAEESVETPSPKDEAAIKFADGTKAKMHALRKR